MRSVETQDNNIMLRNAKYRTFLAIILIIYSLTLLADRLHFDQYARRFVEVQQGSSWL